MPLGDSISKYDGSRDLYSTSPSPLQQKRNLKVEGVKGSTKVDTLETIKKKPDDAVSVILGPKAALFLTGERALKIARAGRFIFYTLAMPPFFVVYTLPKWVLMTVIPPMVAQIERGFEHAKKLFTQLIKNIETVFVTPFRNLLGKISWKSAKIEKQNSSLMTNLRQNVLKITRLLENSLKKTAQILEHNFLVPFRNVTGLVKEKFKSLIKESKELYQTISKAVEKQFENGYEAFIQPLVNLIAPPLTLIQKPIQHVFSLARKIVTEKIRPALNEAVQRVKEVISEAGAKIQQTFTQIVQTVQPVINYLAVAPMQFLKKQLSFGLRWLKEKPKEHLANFGRMARRWIGAISPHLNETLDRTLIKVVGFWCWLLGPLFRLLCFLFNKLFAVVKSTYRFIKIQSSAFHRKFYKQVNPIKQGFVISYNFAIQECKALMKAPLSYCLKLLQKVGLILLKCVRFCALVIIFIFLIFKLWFKMLYEISEDLAAKSRS